MTRQTHKNPRELTQRVLLLALFDCILALCGSRWKRPRTNSIDETDMKQAGRNMPEICLNFNLAKRYHSALSVVHSQKNG